ncbi:SubName: Full=Uncharacterized protein {ECO:0000313/EMBL:CCA77251.1} [Serendipita indica DSM 11827]|nr:SubName: Full=Uncharacterized protein {ECO:0000313/EMBL:CCA77251.1} [Serendipita indica DSM 11827]
MYQKYDESNEQQQQHQVFAAPPQVQFNSSRSNMLEVPGLKRTKLRRPQSQSALEIPLHLGQKNVQGQLDTGIAPTAPLYAHLDSAEDAPGQSSQAHISMLYPKQALLRYSPPTSPLVHLDMYPPSNPVPTLPNACGASVQRVSSLKARQQGQRHEIKPKMLDEAFTPRGFFPDPALRRLFELILSTQFYKDELLEPMLGTPEADAVLEQIRHVAPHDPRFAPGDPSSADTTAAENADRDTQSIYVLFYREKSLLGLWEEDGSEWACIGSRSVRYQPQAVSLHMRQVPKREQVSPFELEGSNP